MSKTVETLVALSPKVYFHQSSCFYMYQDKKKQLQTLATQGFEAKTKTRPFRRVFSKTYRSIPLSFSLCNSFRCIFSKSPSGVFSLTL
ncbi:hypothetical protein, partial [Exiguobacterium sp. s102]|uniref:hypothetical protein n=1 Tax=Exiguobacterium sp. s102 TaxID=2751212 RepID=UPI001BEA9764